MAIYCAVQKSAMKAVVDSRAKLERALRDLKATSTIVFEIKKILERQGFTDVSNETTTADVVVPL